MADNLQMQETEFAQKHENNTDAELYEYVKNKAW